jgi:hypothetical protein
MEQKSTGELPEGGGSQLPKPSSPAKFSLRFTRPGVYDIQFTGDTAAESIDMAISYLEILKKAYHSDGS